MRTACRCRFRGMPPKYVTRGRLPLSRCLMTCRQTRGPCSVSTTLLYLRRIFRAVDLCFAARVLVSDRSMTPRSLPK